MSKLYILLLVFLFMFSCSTEKKKNVQKEDISVQQSNDIDWLMGKTVHYIDSILDIKNNSNFTIYLYNHYDCDDCVNAGFYTCKKISELDEQQKVYVITSTIDNPAKYQKNNDYYSYIYVDSKDMIRRELKYLPTPVLLNLNKNGMILDVYFPKDTMAVHYRDFVNSCLEHD